MRLLRGPSAVHEAVNEFRGLLVAELRSVSFVWVLRIWPGLAVEATPRKKKKKTCLSFCSFMGCRMKLG